MRVRRGRRSPGLDTPQWERDTRTVEVSTAEYCDQGNQRGDTETEEWSYFDYQYMSQALKPDRSIPAVTF